MVVVGCQSLGVLRSVPRASVLFRPVYLGITHLSQHLSVPRAGVGHPGGLGGALTLQGREASQEVMPPCSLGGDGCRLGGCGSV